MLPAFEACFHRLIDKLNHSNNDETREKPIINCHHGPEIHPAVYSRTLFLTSQDQNMCPREVKIGGAV